MQPEEQDSQAVDVMLQIFFDEFLKNVNLIPSNVRAIFRFMRVLCERFLRDEQIYHRAIVGSFILRIVCPEIANPEILKILEIPINPDETQKCIHFSKITMIMANMQYDNLNEKNQKFLSPVFKKYQPQMILFLEEITNIHDGFNVESDNNFEKFISSIESLREIFDKCQTEFEFVDNQTWLLSDLFIFELLAGFLSDEKVQ